MRLRRHAIFLIALTGMFCVFGLAVKMASVQAVGLDDTAPYGKNSTPNGSHDFFLRKHPEQGRQNNVLLTAYFPANQANWGVQYLTINANGDPSATDGAKYACRANTSGSSVVDSQYIIVTITDATKSSNKSKYYIKRANVCRDDSSQFNTENTSTGNQLFARYKLPGAPNSKDDETGLYKFFVSIEYNDGVPNDAGGIHLKVGGSAAGLKLSQQGGEGRSFPILGTWSYHMNPQGGSNIEVPFGLECSAASGTRSIGLYDADNGDAFPGHTLYFKVKDRTTGQYVTIAKQYGTIIPLGADNKAVPADGTSAQAGGEVGLTAGHKYSLEVYDIAADNTVDLQLPADTESIFGDDAFNCEPPDCPQPGGCITTKRVTVTPNAIGDGEYEIGEPITFSQLASVSGFPNSVKNWGYNERAVSKADNQGVYPTRNEFAGGSRGKDTTKSNNVIFRQKCKDGTYNNFPGCEGAGNKYDCINQNGVHDFRNTCADEFNNKGKKINTWQFQWKCVSNDFAPYNGANTKDITQQGKPGCDVYGYNCVGAGDSYVAFGWGDQGPSICRKWECRAPSTFATLDASQKDNNCKIFKCAYGGNEGFAGMDETADSYAAKRCEPRCSRGAGAQAALYAADGDLNCYQQPSFNLNCTWDNQPGQPGGSSGPVPVTADGSGYCYGYNNWQIQRTGPIINGQVCATTSITPNPISWNGIAPGWGLNKAGDTAKQRVNWVIDIAPPDPACARIGNKPYVKVFNGDVSSGTYLSYNGTEAQCNTDGGTISTWNRGPSSYYGSGTTDGVVAAGNVAGFRSNNTNTTLSQKGLTFGNSNAPSQSGWFIGEYGGYYGPHTSGCSQGIAEEIKAAVQVPEGRTNQWSNSVIGNKNKISGNTVIYHEGDLYIMHNFIYDDAAVTNLKDLPRLKIIVKGNIYINRNVTQLDGTYVALATGSGDNATGGNVYTCAAANGGTVAAVDPSQRPSFCNKQLVINGAVQARRIYLGRTFGSLRQAGDETPGTSKAAEVINYGPSVWLPRGGLDTKYETITSLPPVL